MSLPINIRPATSEDDRAFILDNWRTSFRNSPFAYTLSGDVYFAIQKEKMLAALETGKAEIACYGDDPDHFAGFIVHDTNPFGLSIVHYLYVKKHFRSQGVASELLKHIQPTNNPLPVVFIDVTKDFFELRREYSLPYVTARELDDFTNRNPEDPQSAFAGWFRDQVYKYKKRQSKKGMNE